MYSKTKAPPSRERARRRPISLALTQVPLFKPPHAIADVLTAVAQVTGIAPLTLELVQTRIMQSGSLAALQQALRSVDVPKEGGLHYEFVVTHRRRGPQGGREKISQRLLLTLQSARGSVEIKLLVALGRRPMATATERQVIKVCLVYKIATGDQQQVIKHEVVIAGDRRIAPNVYTNAA